jgi:hypothetical protein
MTNNQVQINQAISQADTVYLNSGVYMVDGTISIKSNFMLTGDPNAIIRVSGVYRNNKLQRILKKC